MSDRPPPGTGIFNPWVWLAAAIVWALIIWGANWALGDAPCCRGGSVEEHRDIVLEANRTGQRVEIRATECLSACTMYLGVNNVCVDPDTQFGFHGGRLRGKLDGRVDHLIAQVYPPALGAWFLSHAAGKVMLRYMTGAELIERFDFKAC